MGKVNSLSAEARRVLKGMDPNQKEMILKGHPFQKDRNEAIAALGRKGTKGILLAEITGLSVSSISRIVATGGNNDRACWPRKKEMELRAIEREFEKLFDKVRRFFSGPKGKEVKGF